MVNIYRNFFTQLFMIRFCQYFLCFRKKSFFWKNI